METRNIRHVLRTIFLLICICYGGACKAQQGLDIATLFEKFGDRKNVTMVELNSSLLRSYQMTLYKSLVFKDVRPFLNEILKSLRTDANSGNVTKTQEIKESGRLGSAYYCLAPTLRNGQKVNRYILFKQNRQHKAALVYIEGTLNEDDLMKILYKEE